MRTTAADRSHNATQRNATQHKQQQQQQVGQATPLSFFFSLLLVRTRRASPAGSKKRCACCCPTAWWCLPACLPAAKVVPLGHLRQRLFFGRTDGTPQTGGGTTDRKKVRGVYFWNTSVGAGGYQMPRNMDPEDIRGDYWGVFFWFFLGEKGWCYFSSSTWAKISLNITYKK